MEITIQDKETKLKEFEELCYGRSKLPELDYIYNLPFNLIQWRIGKQWSIFELAEAVGLQYIEVIALEKNNYMAGTWTDDEIRTLANKFKGSKQVLIRRLLTFNFISQQFYTIKQKAYEQQSEKPASGEKKSIAVPQHTKAIAASGKLFTRLVLSSYQAEMITGLDASNYLSVRVKHLPKIESAVYK